MVSRADLRKISRRAVHAAFAVPIGYIPKGSSYAWTYPTDFQYPLTARFHTKVKVDPDPLGGGYAQIIDTNTRVIFNMDELTANNINPRTGDLIYFPDYGFRVRLDIMDANNGPITQKWTVTKR